MTGCSLPGQSLVAALSTPRRRPQAWMRRWPWGRAGGADSLKAGSQSRPAFSSTKRLLQRARQRLPVPFLLEVLQLLGGKILQPFKPRRFMEELAAGFAGRQHRAPALLWRYPPAKFPPHRNQHATARSYWCLMRVVVGFCAFSGAALDCAHEARCTSASRRKALN